MASDEVRYETYQGEKVFEEAIELLKEAVESGNGSEMDARHANLCAAHLAAAEAAERAATDRVTAQWMEASRQRTKDFYDETQRAVEAARREGYRQGTLDEHKAAPDIMLREGYLRALDDVEREMFPMLKPKFGKSLADVLEDLRKEARS